MISRPIIATAISLVALLALSDAVLADLEFTEGAETEFSDNQEFSDALDRLRSTDEGQRIEDAIDDAEVEVTIDVVDDADVADGDAYGTTQVTERDADGNPTKILIKVAKGDTGGTDNLADTIQHELRHAEIMMGDDSEADHDALDAGTDPNNVTFVDQIAGLATPTPAATATPTPTPAATPTPTPTPTPTAAPTGEPSIPRVISSKYSAFVVVIFDEAKHEDFILLPSNLVLEVFQSDINFRGPDPWVEVTGTLADDGSFTATGSGTVAGFPNIAVTFEGTITPDELAGDYTMGAEGGLPQGQPIIYRVEGQSTP